MGHRCVPHTADVRIEAWAPTRERCVAEAIAAMVGCFVQVPDEAPRSEVVVKTQAARDEDLLVAALDEVLYRWETSGQIPARARAQAVPGGMRLSLQVIDADRAELIGAVPKAVTLHELRFAAEADGWFCSVILDV